MTADTVPKGWLIRISPKNSLVPLSFGSVADDAEVVPHATQDWDHLKFVVISRKMSEHISPYHHEI